jgi:hypothetical protein
LLVVSEPAIERDHQREPERDLPFDNVLLDSWTLDLARRAVGSGLRTRFDGCLYFPKRPLGPLLEFDPDVIIAAGGAASDPRPRISRPGGALARHFMRTAGACSCTGADTPATSERWAWILIAPCSR